MAPNVSPDMATCASWTAFSDDCPNMRSFSNIAIWATCSIPLPSYCIPPPTYCIPVPTLPRSCTPPHSALFSGFIAILLAWVILHLAWQFPVPRFMDEDKEEGYETASVDSELEAEDPKPNPPIKQQSWEIKRLSEDKDKDEGMRLGRLIARMRILSRVRTKKTGAFNKVGRRKW